VTEIGAEKVLTTRNPATDDSGKVRLGLLSPSFPPVRTTPPSAADKGQVRIGLLSPSFPLSRTR
jgi:hypothetical protein